MSQYTIVSSIDRSTSYPIDQVVSAPASCGTITLQLTNTFTKQMLCELPAVNIKILTGANNVKYDFNVDMSTVNDMSFDLSGAEPYSIQVMDIPSSCKISLTPLFDKYALESHNEMIKNGVVEDLTTSDGIVDNTNDNDIWTTPTATFPISIKFDNSSIKSGTSSGGGGGGGGGATTAYDVSYDNSASGLIATNVQDAIDELVARQTKVMKTETTMTLISSYWSAEGEYTISNADIEPTSDIYLDVPSTVTQEQYNAIAQANIVAVDQSSGSLTIKATGTTPTINVPIKITIITIS